jgi:DNA-directed RNA polymerase subunit omega
MESVRRGKPFGFPLFWEADMARITVEDCLQMGGNRFELVSLGSKRASQLFKGAKPLFETDNREFVTALREVATGKVRHAKESTCDALI